MEEPRNPDVCPFLSEADRRVDATVIATLSQRFADFIERYDRDCGAANERYRNDSETNKEWREKIQDQLNAQKEILSDIAPAYARAKWVIALSIIGSIALAVKAFWKHIMWN
jgi:hypothetical protein